MIQNLHFEKVSIWLQIDRNPYMVADNRELRFQKNKNTLNRREAPPKIPGVFFLD